MKLHHALLAIAPFFGLLMFAPKAHADLVFNLGGEADDDGCSGTGGCQGGTSTVLGTIDLQQVDATHVLVTETLANLGICGGVTCFVKTGNHDALTFNIAGDPAITISSLTTGFSVDASPSNPVPEGTTWDYGIFCSGCGSGASSPLPGPLSFTVSRTGGGNLLVTDFAGGGTDDYFASDIISGITGNTGAVAADGPGTVTPEPRTTVVMLAAGLLMALAFRRKKTVTE